ncbi:MAG: DNA polymerase I [Oligoflexia bacterium]|nr:DNA polymerase I [Oligoflexia bacterium]
MTTSNTQASGPTRDKLFLIDGSNTAFRAFYAMQTDMRAPDGMPTRALFGFTRILLKLLKDHHPTHCAVVFDKGLSFRNTLFPDYKGQRPDMPEDLRAQWDEFPGLCQDLGVRPVVQAGYEADDIIGCLAVKHAGPQMDVVIVSSDKDFGQLVNDRVQMLDVGKNQMLGAAEIHQKWGVYPDRVVDLLALMGDTSDNVPGIKGVGPKKAAAFLQRFGDLEGVLEHAADIGGKTGQRVAASKEIARLSRTLVTIVTDFSDEELGIEAGLDFVRLSEPDRPKLARRLARYNFKSLARELGLDGQAAAEGDLPAAPQARPPGPTIDRGAYRTIQTTQDLDWLVDQLRQAGHFAFDTETTSLDPRAASLVGMSFAWCDEFGVYVPIDHAGGGNCPGALEALLPLLADPKLTKIGQNLKYDLSILRSLGHDLQGIVGDTMLADYLVDVDRKHNLDELAERHLGHRMLAYKDVTADVDLDFRRVDVATATAYAAEDAHIVWLLDHVLGPALGSADELGPASVYRDIEIPLVPVLADMELTGIGVDLPGLQALGRELGERIDDLVARLHAEAGVEWNVNSTQQLAALLFEERGHKPVKKTAKRTGFSTDSATLEQLARTVLPATGLIDPLPRLVLDYRELAKLKNTYADALPRAIASDGRIHTNFHQAVAATGRLSSNDPNLQNIPVRSNDGRRIRQCFIAGPGRQIVSADYSQVELRVLAHFCGEGALVDAFRSGRDIHRATAADIFGVDLDQVSTDQRRAAKAINFGIVYGMSAFRLARELDIGRAEAKRYIDGYFERYPQVRRYMESAVQFALTHGHAQTLLGRRRPIRGLDSRNFNVRSGAERIAINTPVQGSAADLIKLAMLRVHARLGREQPSARLLLQVHDELLVECPWADVPAVQTRWPRSTPSPCPWWSMSERAQAGARPTERPRCNSRLRGGVRLAASAHASEEKACPPLTMHPLGAARPR